MANGELPRRLTDLDDETIGWLDRLTTEERQALIFFGHLPKFKRDRLNRFLDLPQEHFDAGFAVVQLWTRLKWMSGTAMKIILAVAGGLLAISQISAWFVGKHP